MCGYSSRECNPYALTASPSKQKLLLLINSNPLSINDIAEKLGIPVDVVTKYIKELVKCGLIKEVSGLYKPSFAIFTLKDQEVLKSLVKELVNDVVKVIDSYKDELLRCIHSLSIVKRGLRFPDLEYVIIGAITLDYEALDVLSEEGILIKSKEMPGGKYIFAGFEIGLLDFKKLLMWGHNEVFGKYWFSSHGELPPSGRRAAFPDLTRLWYTKGVSVNEIKFRMIEIGRILEALLHEDLTLENLWRKSCIDRFDLAMYLNTLLMLKYVIILNGRVWRLNIPVFTPKDYEIIKSLSRRILKSLAKKFKNRKDLIKEYYSRTSPARNEVPLEESFNLIYHVIFARALDELIKHGIIKEPPRRPDGGRYSVFMVILKE